MALTPPPPPPTAGIDPGKKGYVCAMNLPHPYLAHTPFFWPVPIVTTSEGVDDDHPRYDLPGMWSIANALRDSGVRLVVIEEQAPRAHGKVKEGTVSSWSNGYGFGLWEMALVAAGFVRAPDARTARASVTGDESVLPTPVRAYLIVPPSGPGGWKPAMGCLVTTHRGEDSHAARRKAAAQKTIAVAKHVDPSVDYRAVERTPGAKVDSPDKAVARLLAEWALRGVLGVTK